jgi:AraC-like DNA-binding protein
MQPTVQRRQLLVALQQQILPCLQNDEQWRMVLAEPPFNLPPEVSIRFHSGRPLANSRAKKSNILLSTMTSWPGAEVHSNSVPYMGFVLKGAMDWRIGITTSMARRHGGVLKRSDYAVLEIPENTFFIAPPGVPYGTGVLPHWERNQEIIPHDIFWVRFYPLGVQCHMRHSHPQSNQPGQACLFPDSRLYPASLSLLEELRTNDKNSTAAISGLLQFIMARLIRGLEAMQTAKWRPIGPEITDRNNAAHAVEAACSYIEANFHRKLSLEEIATHALTSPTHLSHLFRREKQQTLTDYITRLRMDYAASLLEHTRLNMSQVANTIGYNNQAYFCQVFSKHFHCSPSEFRTNAIKQKGSQNN